MVYLDKKKLISNELFCWHFFILYFIVPLVCCFGMLSAFSNCYAMSSDDINNVVNNFLLNVENNNPTPNLNSLLELENDWGNLIINSADSTNQNRISNSDRLIISEYSGVEIYFCFILDDTKLFYISNNTLIQGSSAKVLRCQYWQGNFYYQYYSSNYGFASSTTNNIYRYISNTSIYDYHYQDNEIDYNTTTMIYFTDGEPPAPPNSITLTAGLNSFHRYQGVGNKKQLLVYLDGYVLDDFTFFVEQYIDNEWQIVTGINDYYILFDEENNDIYSNPYYITFANLIYLPAGTFRYTALLNDNPETAFYSDTFTITSWSIYNDANRYC